MFPILNPPPSFLPIPSLWVVPVHQPQASSIVHRTWTGNSFHTWYFTCFNAILPNLPTLSPFLTHILVSYDLLYFCIVCCNFSSLISNFIDLSLLPSLPMNFVYLLKEPTFSFIDLWYCLIYFCPDIYDIVFILPPLGVFFFFLVFL